VISVANSVHLVQHVHSIELLGQLSSVQLVSFARGIIFLPRKHHVDRVSIAMARVLPATIKALNAERALITIKRRQREKKSVLSVQAAGFVASTDWSFLIKSVHLVATVPLAYQTPAPPMLVHKTSSVLRAVLRQYHALQVNIKMMRPKHYAKFVQVARFVWGQVLH